ncbi:hypothetical protein Tco_1375609 [Tanacetum coccineum]
MTNIRRRRIEECSDLPVKLDGSLGTRLLYLRWSHILAFVILFFVVGFLIDVPLGLRSNKRNQLPCSRICSGTNYQFDMFKLILGSDNSSEYRSDDDTSNDED